MTVGVLAVSLAGTGCATKKYVTKTIEPVQQRLATAESKNAEQDTKLAENAKQLDELGTDLSRTKEKLNDTDAKATQAGQAAQQAGTRADGAQRTADGARTLAQQGIEKTDKLATDVQRTIDGINKYQMAKSEAVTFKVNQHKLSNEAKAQLDEIAKMVEGQERYLIEVQGFTDKTGSPAYNEMLSQERASEVARYLVNEHKIPLRAISQLGSGYAQPVGDDKTREGRSQNRRVEVRVFVPEIPSAAKAMTAQVGGQK